MAWQLIYTSAPRTLTAGQTGYGTVARSLDLRDALIQRLEQLSCFQHGHAHAAPPVVHAYRIVDVRGAKYHVLTRCVDAGLDFTNRTNHLAHHLVFTPEELAALPSPALIFQHWSGWRNTWAGDPRFLDAGDLLAFAELPRTAPLPANEWARLTGDAGRAAALLTRPAANGCYLACEPGRETEWLTLFAESLQLLDPEQKSPAQRWQIPFTTCLQEQDQPNDFRWRGCEPGSAAALRAAAPLLAPADLPLSTGELAELARRGPKKSFAASLAPRANTAPAAWVKPVAAKADIPSAGPMRPRGKASSPTAWVDDDSPDESRRSSNARRMVPVAGLALLFLFLITGFWKPGWFKPHPRAKISSPASTNLVSTAPSPTNGLLPPDAEDLSKSTGGIKAPPLIAPKSVPSATATSELNMRLDSVPTYLHLHDFSKPLEIPAHSRLASLFQIIMANDRPVPESAIDYRAVSDVLRLDAPEASVTARVRVSKEEKHLRAIRDNSAPEEFRIDFSEWFLRQAGTMVLQFAEPPRSSMSILFQPKDGTSFEPFRILVADDRQRPAPVQLSKAFLSVDQTNFENTVDALVRGKLKAITLPPKAKWQLRPFVEAGGRPRDLAAVFQLAQAEGSELNLRLARDELDRRVVATNILWSNSLAEVTRLKTEVHHAHTNDLELGRLLGHEGNSLSSFRAFAQDPAHNAGRMDRAAFKRYLHQVLKGRIGEKEMGKLDQERTRDEALQYLDEHLTKGGKAVPSLPPDYFTTRWKNLGFMDKLAAAETAHKAADKSFREIKETLTRAPRSLDDLDYVSLEVVDGNRRLELIRFTDPPKKTKP